MIPAESVGGASSSSLMDSIWALALDAATLFSALHSSNSAKLKGAGGDSSSTSTDSIWALCLAAATLFSALPSSNSAELKGAGAASSSSSSTCSKFPPPTAAGAIPPPMDIASSIVPVGGGGPKRCSADASAGAGVRGACVANNGGWTPGDDVETVGVDDGRGSARPSSTSRRLVSLTQFAIMDLF